jgi:hypothetical protein
MAGADYTGISITIEARSDLRRFAAAATGALGERVTMTDALRLAIRIASDHLAEVPGAWQELSAPDTNGEAQ